MRVHLESKLDCDAEAAWERVKTSAMLLQVSRPLVDVRPVAGEQLPLKWEQGMRIRCRVFLLAFLPLGTRRLYFERVDDRAREIQTREQDPLIRRWDHLIRVSAAGEGGCRYCDTVEIEAGLLTVFVWLFAQCFYRHRRRRWRKLAAGF